MMKLYNFLFLSATLIILGSCSKVKAAPADSIDAAFEYREIYLPETTGANAPDFHLNSVDHDWGIWGHNIVNILPEKPSQSIYAKRNGVAVKDQFCFMSDRLYEYIEEFIDRKYGDDETVRFAILPQDNEIVCLCTKCLDEGNTRRDASPAVFNMIRRLSDRFPNHQFFTSYYQTTKGLPGDSLPANAGVLVSAMDYPLSAAPTPSEQSFLNVLGDWNRKTKRIYVWDYINNFDDYFTPFPVFNIMQRRMKLYRDNGVSGVFFNGSGTDYSTFSALKGKVLAEMTIDPDIDWRTRLREIAAEDYPVAGSLIADFMISQEDFVAEKGLPLPLYEGVAKARQTYLPEDKFVEFYEKLSALQPQTKGAEREAVDKMLRAMAMTRLELNRLNASVKGSHELVSVLKGDGKDTGFYNESAWTVDNYIRDYDNLLSHSAAYGSKDKLRGARLQALTPLDPDYSDLSILTDGFLGLPSNYHSGNLINSNSELRIAVPPVSGAKKLRVGLVYNPAYRIELPAEVKLLSGTRQLDSKNPSFSDASDGHLFLEFDMPSSSSGTLVLSIVKDPDSHSFAIDEIEAY